MLIAQISDLHIGFGSAHYRELNSDRLSQVVERLIEIAPDLLLVTGDLTEHGDADSYARLKALLEPLRMPKLLAVGNHDRRAAFADAFPETERSDGFVQYAYDTVALRIVVLDTLEEGFQSGTLCTRRIRWLDACLAERPEVPTLLALHHPPAPTGVTWMDTNSDGDWTARLACILERHSQVVAIVGGHIHRATVSAFAGRPLITTSSTAPQVALDLHPIDPAVPDGRPLIVAQAPAFALHQWLGGRILTHFATAEDDPVLARFDAAMQPMIAAITGEAEAPDPPVP